MGWMGLSHFQRCREAIGKFLGTEQLPVAGAGFGGALNNWTGCDELCDKDKLTVSKEGQISQSLSHLFGHIPSWNMDVDTWAGNAEGDVNYHLYFQFQ